MSTSPTSPQVLNSLNTPSEISQKRSSQEAEQFGLFVPDEARLSLESLKQSHNDVKRFIRQFTRYGGDFREELDESISLLEQQEQNSVSRIMKRNFGIARPEVLYLIYQALEPQYSSDQLRMVYNILAREGYTEVVRKKSFKEVEELFNQIYNIVRDRLRHYLNSRLPLPDPIVRDGKVHIMGELTPMESIHKNKILNLLDRLAAIARDFALHLTLYNPRMKDMRGLIERFARQISQGYMTCFYAGMRQGVTRSDLVGEGKPLSSTWVTKEDLEKQYQQFKDAIRKLPRYGAGLTTVSKVVDSEVDYEKIDRGQEMINQIRSWERDPTLLSMEELEQMDHEEVMIRKILSQHQPSKAITDKYATQVAKTLSREKRWKGTQLHRYIPSLLGLPMYNTIKDMVENPERYDLLGNGWLIATEVKIYEDNRYGEIDFLILKFVDVEYGEGWVEVPYVMAVLDRKTESHVEFNITPEYRPSRLEKRNLELLRKNVEDPDPSKIALRLLHDQDKLPGEIKEQILHTTMTKSSRTHRQVELYSKMAINFLNTYKREELDLTGDIFEQKDCILGAIKVDSFYQSSRDLENIAVQEWKLWTSALRQLEQDSSSYVHSVSRHQVTHPDLPDVGLVLSLGGFASPILEDAVIPDLYAIDPFTDSIHAGKGRSHAEIPDTLKIHLHYPVKGRHHSNEFVAEMSSLHYLLEQQAIPGKTLLLDVSGYLTEFTKERILGLSRINPDLLDILISIDIVSCDLSQSPIIDLDRTYHNVVVWGLQELAKECQGRRYHQRVVSHRRKILAALNNICSDIYLIDRVVRGARQVISHGQSTLLPFQPKKYLGDSLHLSHLASISYNLPRSPISILSSYDTTDAVRHIMTFTAGTKEPAHQLYTCPRFAGESRSWDHVESRRGEPTWEELKESSDFEHEVAELENFFPWSFKRRKFTYQLWDGWVEFSSISCQPECRKTWDHTYVASGLATVVFNPLRDLSTQLKYGYPLLTGLFAGFRAYQVRNQPAPRIKPKQVSTRTPYLTIFQRDGRQYPILMATRKNPELIDLELDWMARIHKWVLQIVPNGDDDIIQSRLYELVRRYRPELDPDGAKKKTKELAQMLQPVVDLDVFDSPTYRDMSYSEKESLLIGLANSIEIMGDSNTKDALKNIRRKLPQELLTFLNMDPISGRSPPTNWFEQLRVGNWLVLLFALAFQICRFFDTNKVVQYLSRQLGWILVQLGISRNPKRRLAQFRYRMYPKRVLHSILEHIENENSFVQELVAQTGVLVEAIRPVRVCLHQKTLVLSLKEDNAVHTYFLDRDKQRFGAGQMFEYDHDYHGGENLQQNHLDHELYCITWDGKDYLYTMKDHALESVAQLSFFEKEETRLVFLNYSNAPSILKETYVLPSFDHTEIELPEYYNTIPVIPYLTMNSAWDYELRYIRADDHNTIFAPFTSHRLEHIFDDVLGVCAEPQEVEYEGESIRIFSPSIRLQSGVTEDIENIAKLENILEQVANELFQYKIQQERASPKEQYLLDSIDVKDLYFQKIEEHDVSITIGFDMKRAARSGGDKIVELQGKPRIRHKQTYYVEIDNPEFRSVAARLLAIDLEEGRSYLSTYDIERLAGRRILFDPEDTWDKWNIRVILPTDGDEVQKLLDDDRITRVVNTWKPWSSARTTEVGSFDKKIKWKVVKYTINERGYSLSLRHLGLNYNGPGSVKYDTSCDFVANLKKLVRDADSIAGVPLSEIDQTDEIFQNFMKEVECKVLEHEEECTDC